MVRVGLLIGVWVGCSGGNFLFQASTSQDWHMAVMRSYFQAWPLFALWIAQRFTVRAEGR
jgi:hypothetical protein